MRHPIWWGLCVGLCFAAAFSAVALAAAAFGDGEGFFEEGLFEIGESAPKVLTVFWVGGLIGGLLLGVLSTLGKRVDRTAPRNRRLWNAFVVLLVAWLGLHGPIRAWVGTAGLVGPWVLGVSPSFFAGLAIAFWSALAYGIRPLFAGVFGAGLIVLTEISQLWLPSYTFDLWDVIAGLVGAGLAIPLLMRWPVAVQTESAPTTHVERS